MEQVKDFAVGENNIKHELKREDGFVTDRLTNIVASTDNDNIKITNLYLCSLFLSPFLHIMDVGTDLYLAYQYYSHDEKTYFLLTATLIVFPSLVTTIFSIRM